MPVFYRGPRAVVTDQRIVVAHESRRVYRIAELSAIHIVRTRPDPGTRWYRMMGVSAMVAALVMVPIADPLPTGLVIASLGCLAAYVTVCLRGRPRPCWQLMACYRGELTVLFESSDEREFDQVARGLVRSLEYAES